jgi:hypothetical protein
MNMNENALGTDMFMHFYGKIMLLNVVAVVLCTWVQKLVKIIIKICQAHTCCGAIEYQ